MQTKDTSVCEIFSFFCCVSFCAFLNFALRVLDASFSQKNDNGNSAFHPLVGASSIQYAICSLPAFIFFFFLLAQNTHLFFSFFIYAAFPVFTRLSSSITHCCPIVTPVCLFVCYLRSCELLPLFFFFLAFMRRSHILFLRCVTGSHFFFSLLLPLFTPLI